MDGDYELREKVEMTAVTDEPVKRQDNAPDFDDNFRDDAVEVFASEASADGLLYTVYDSTYTIYKHWLTLALSNATLSWM